MMGYGLKKFPTNQATCCDSERVETKDDVKNTLKYQKSELKKWKEDLNACRQLLGSYEYDPTKIYEIIGRVFVNMTNTKISIKETKKKLKGMK